MAKKKNGLLSFKFLEKLRGKKLGWGRVRIVTVSVVILVLLSSVAGALVYMWHKPIQEIERDTDGNKISFSKFPLFGASITVYRDNEVIVSSKLRGFDVDGEIDADFGQDGMYRIVYKVGGSEKVVEFEVDRTAPEIAAEFSDLTNKETITISVKLNEEGAVMISYKTVDVDEETGDGVEGVAEIRVDEKAEVPVSEGENIYIVHAEDEWGNKSEAEVKIIGDFTKPVAEITEPSYSETYNKSATIKVKVSDEMGVAKVTINDKEVQPDESGVCSIDVQFEDGDNLIKVVITDLAGNGGVAEKTILKRVYAADRINSSSSGSSGGGDGSGGTGAGCSDSLSGYNIYCWNNQKREDTGLYAYSWSSKRANHAYWYAYCLDKYFTGGNPHHPNQEVTDCIQEKSSLPPNTILGCEVISSGYSSASSVVSKWAGSSVHSSCTLSNQAKVFGAGGYGTWAVAYADISN